MVDLRLNDEGDLELAEFGESFRDAILEKAYRLREAMMAAPVTPSGGTLQPKAKRWSAKQCRRNERARSNRPVRPSPQPRRPEHSGRPWVFESSARRCLIEVQTAPPSDVTPSSKSELQL
jgi:hypothetical protein